MTAQCASSVIRQSARQPYIFCTVHLSPHSLDMSQTGIILCMRPANERQSYNVTLSPIGWAHAQNDPCPHKYNNVMLHITRQKTCQFLVAVLGPLCLHLQHQLLPRNSLGNSFYCSINWVDGGAVSGGWGGRIKLPLLFCASWLASRYKVML